MATIRSEWAEAEMPRSDAEDLRLRIDSRVRAFAHDHPNKGGNADAVTITRRVGMHGYTFKVRGCSQFRSLLLAAITGEQTVSDI